MVKASASLYPVRFMSLSFRCGQRDAHRRAPSNLALNVDRTLMFFDDTTANGEAEARPFAFILGCKERLPDV